MRPGIVFVGLFALLTALYVLMASSLGNVLTFILQAAIVLALLGAVLWFRKLRSMSGGGFLSDDGATGAPPASSEEESESVRLAP